MASCSKLFQQGSIDSRPGTRLAVTLAVEQWTAQLKSSVIHRINAYISPLCVLQLHSIWLAVI